jgi:AcrR family transcriptional regulator
MSRDLVRTQILQVAGGIFATEGYRQATIRQICQQAGVNVAAIHYYFGDKERLYGAAVRNAREMIERRWPMPDWPPDVDADERLRAFIRVFLQRLLSSTTEDWQIRLILREVVEPTRAGEELVREGFFPFFEVLESILRHLVPAATPAHRLHQLGFSLIGQCVFYRFHQRIVALMISPDERAEHFQLESLGRHIYFVTRAAIDRMAHESAYECSETVRKSLEY